MNQDMAMITQKHVYFNWECDETYQRDKEVHFGEASDLVIADYQHDRQLIRVATYPITHIDLVVRHIIHMFAASSKLHRTNLKDRP